MGRCQTAQSVAPAVSSQINLVKVSVQQYIGSYLHINLPIFKTRCDKKREKDEEQETVQKIS